MRSHLIFSKDIMETIYWLTSKDRYSILSFNNLRVLSYKHELWCHLTPYLNASSNTY